MLAIYQWGRELSGKYLSFVMNQTQDSACSITCERVTWTACAASYQHNDCIHLKSPKWHLACEEVASLQFKWSSGNQ